MDAYNITVIFYSVTPKFFMRRVLIQSAFDSSSLMWLVFVRYHSLITFILIIFGFVSFIINLSVYGNVSYQMRNWGWSMIAAMLLCYLGLGFTYTIYQGMFWFVFTVICVVINDIAAYLVGISLGKTPLIKLSPKKTWEGFIGGLVFTFIWSFITVRYLVGIKFLVCPQPNLSISFFENIDCVIPEIFQYHNYPIHLFNSTHPILNISVSPIQFHAVIIATFASLIAPFGGFFASGLKRAMKIKNFGVLIPGHGGMSDRMDCKAIMGIFIYIYLTQIVYRHQNIIERAFDHFMNLESKD